MNIKRMNKQFAVSYVVSYVKHTIHGVLTVNVVTDLIEHTHNADGVKQFNIYYNACVSMFKTDDGVVHGLIEHENKKWSISGDAFWNGDVMYDHYSR